MLQIGSLLDNKYKILSEVGHGGMSVVYLAINERANKTWAVKEVRKDGTTDFESVRQGLVVETDMLKKLHHAHLPSIIDVIDTEDSFLIVMDYIEGTSLQKKMKTEGAQPEEKVVKWGKQLCDVLGYLHSQNPPIIYRDMKPANVMLKPDGNVTLIDFGTAREFKNRAMVEDTTCLGTRGYAAPEQFGGRGQTDPRTDIYCLGATLYHLITGHSPAEPPYEIKPLSYWIPQYAGSGLEKVILKCTQQDPTARYQNCAELMYALEHYSDEDDANRARRRRKWAAFVSSIIIGAVGLVSTIGFSLALNGAKSDTVATQIARGNQEATLKKAQKYYLTALKLDPANDDIYQAILDKAKTDISADEKNVLPADTQSALTNLLYSTASGANDTYIDRLKSGDEEEYCEVMYQVGCWYYFYKGDSDSYKTTAAQNYFQKIVDLDSTNWDSGRLQIVTTLNEIGNELANLNDTSQLDLNTATDATANWATFYTQLTELVNVDSDTGESLLDRVSNNTGVALCIYKFAADKMGTYYYDFEKGGVPKQQLLSTLNTIQDSLSAMTVGSSDQTRYDSATKSVKSAIETVENSTGN